MAGCLLLTGGGTPVGAQGSLLGGLGVRICCPTLSQTHPRPLIVSWVTGRKTGPCCHSRTTGLGGRPALGWPQLLATPSPPQAASGGGVPLVRSRGCPPVRRQSSLAIQAPAAHETISEAPGPRGEQKSQNWGSPGIQAVGGRSGIYWASAPMSPNHFSFSFGPGTDGPLGR